MKRALAFERVRAASLKSTWVFPLIGVTISVLAAVLGNATASDGWSNTLSDYVPSSYTFISALFITIPFAQAFGHEYRDGTMRLTLSLFPHRRQVFAEFAGHGDVVFVEFVFHQAEGAGDDRVDVVGLEVHLARG